ncbi:MAG: thermonuclease family protein [Alphaproteobacteria bacterium]
MKNIVTIILALTTLFFAHISYAQEDFILPEGNFETLRKDGTAFVDEAISPLTLRLNNGKFIHLAGLDIPDFDVHDPGELTETAINILNDFLKGQEITIYQTTSSNRGRINRLNHHIAHIVRKDDNVWVQGMLISLGIARVRTTKYNPEMATQMYALESLARARKHGLWAMTDFPILSPEQAENHIGSYQVVEGTVRSAAMRKNRVYLNFGNNWRDDFTASISSSNLRSFNKQGIDTQSWNGKKIRVRGWLSYRNGPYIEVDHPERFETPQTKQSQKTNTLDGSALPNSPRKTKSKKKKSSSALPNLND